MPKKATAPKTPRRKATRKPRATPRADMTQQDLRAHVEKLAEKAREELEKAGGKLMTLDDLNESLR